MRFTTTGQHLQTEVLFFLGKVKNISEFKFDEILHVFVLKYFKVCQELMISFLSLLKLHLSLKSLIQLLGTFVLVSILFDKCLSINEKGCVQLQ